MTKPARDPYQVIIDAARRGAGVTLTKAECRLIAARPEIIANAGVLATEWREIPGYPGYEVSETGQVRHDFRPLKVTRSKHGHGCVSVYFNRKQWRAGVHQLVALAFLGPAPTNRPFACHRNGFAWDNRVQNIYWGSMDDNAADAKFHQLSRGKIRAAKQRSLITNENLPQSVPFTRERS